MHVRRWLVLPCFIERRGRRVMPRLVVLCGRDCCAHTVRRWHRQVVPGRLRRCWRRRVPRGLDLRGGECNFTPVHIFWLLVPQRVFEHDRRGVRGQQFRHQRGGSIVYK